jgi:hypothetical protein
MRAPVADDDGEGSPDVGSWRKCARERMEKRLPTETDGVDLSRMVRFSSRPTPPNSCAGFVSCHIVLPTGDLVRGQRRRTVDESAPYRECHPRHFF